MGWWVGEWYWHDGDPLIAQEGTNIWPAGCLQQPFPRHTHTETFTWAAEGAEAAHLHGIGVEPGAADALDVLQAGFHLGVACRRERGRVGGPAALLVEAKIS